MRRFDFAWRATNGRFSRQRLPNPHPCREIPRDVREMLLNLRPDARSSGEALVFNPPIPIFVLAIASCRMPCTMVQGAPPPEVVERRVFESLGSDMRLREMMIVECADPYGHAFERSILVATFGGFHAIVFQNGLEDTPYAAVAFGPQGAIVSLLTHTLDVLPTWPPLEGSVLRVVNTAGISEEDALKLAGFIAATPVDEMFLVL